MIYLTEEQRLELNKLNFSLNKNRNRESYTHCLAYIMEILKKIYTDGYVTSLEIFPELKRCVSSLADFRNESECDFINGMGLKTKQSEITIKTSSQFEYAYKEAEEKQFVVSDCLKFYFACDLIAKYCGVTPSETQADFFLARVNPGKTFNYNGYPAPNRESLLVHAVKCAQENLDFQGSLPTSYLLYLSGIVAKNEHMTISEWFKQRIKPLSNGIPTPMPYMLASEKSIRDELAAPESEKSYFKKIVHYISWNKLPKDIIVNALPSFAQTNSFLQAYKTSKPSNHKLHKPNSYSNSVIYNRLSDISWSNPNNFLGKKDKEFYKKVLLDLRLFIGDSNNLQYLPRELKPILLKLKKSFKKEIAIEDFLKRYDNPEIIGQREKFKEENSKKSNITIRNPGSSIEEEFIKDLKLNYPQGLLPNNLFEQSLGQRAAQISEKKSTQKIEYLKSLDYSFTENESSCLIPEKELIKQIKAKYPKKQITSTDLKKHELLYIQTKNHARLSNLTIKQYLETKGFSYMVEKSKGLTNDDIKALLKKDFPDGIITVPLITIPYHNHILFAADRARMLKTEFLESLGFKATAKKGRKSLFDASKEHDCSKLVQQLEYMFPNRIITKKIEGTKLYSKIRTFARKNNTSVLQCYKDWGFECETIDIKVLSEKEFWQMINKMHANKIIPKDFESSVLGRKGLSLAKSHNQEFEEYANANGFMCAKLYNENATIEDVIKKLWLTFPDGIITDKQFFRTAIGVRLAKEAISKNIDPTDFVEDLGFSFENKTKGIERQ